jgi:hypothetical protein
MCSVKRLKVVRARIHLADSLFRLKEYVGLEINMVNTERILSESLLPPFPLQQSFVPSTINGLR